MLCIKSLKSSILNFIGTPIQNKIEELGSLLNIVTNGKFSDPKLFKQHYVEVREFYLFYKVYNFSHLTICAFTSSQLSEVNRKKPMLMQSNSAGNAKPTLKYF